MQKKEPFLSRLKLDLKRNYCIYLMILPTLLFFLIFCYGPYFGLTIAFKNYRPALGVWGSKWVGLKYFKSFFTSYYCGRLIRNTLLLSGLNLLVSFPIPIVFALLLNEVRSRTFKRTIQTITYLPHFISIMVMSGIVISFCQTDGIFNQIRSMIYPDIEPVYLLQVPGNFRPIYILSGVWQEFGWNSIIYLAALSGINPDLYEAAMIDGANRWKQTLHVTIPGILPTVAIMLILSCGSIMSVGWEKVVLLYNDAIMETADVLDSYVYRRGLLEANYSQSTAIGMFSQVVNMVFVIIVNKIVGKISGNSLL